MLCDVIHLGHTFMLVCPLAHILLYLQAHAWHLISKCEINKRMKSFLNEISKMYPFLHPSQNH